MTKKITHYSPTIPKTVSVRELQRQYRAVSNKLNEEGTLVVMNYSDPDMILLSKKEYEAMQKKIAKMEEEMEENRILEDIEEYKKEKKTGTLKTIASLKDLF